MDRPDGDDKVGILVVDDRPEGRLTLRAVLSQPDYDIVEASSGKEALARLLDHEFAVVLLDVQMPGMDGFETAAAIRGHAITQDVPIIFVTAISKERGFQFQGYELGAVDFLLKPIDDHALRSKVAVFCQLYKNARTVRRQAEELRRRNQELEAFSYSVAHDLRSPLRSIHSFSQLIQRKYGAELPPAAREEFEHICGATKKMSDVIDGLLSLSRLSQAELKREEVSLSDLANAVLTDLRRSSPERNVAAEIAPGVKARGDVRLLHALLHNLLANAWKFSSNAANALIRFRSFERDGETVFVVEDNGMGFDMAYSAKLFQPFQRLHPENVPGTGVGLAIVKRVAERHGGRVWAEGHTDRGAAFFFTLAQRQARPALSRSLRV